MILLPQYSKTDTDADGCILWHIIISFQTEMVTVFIISAKWTDMIQIVDIKGEAIWTHYLNVSLRIRDIVSVDITLFGNH